MEMGQYSQPLASNGNGKHIQPLPLLYQTQVPVENNNEEEEFNLRQLLTIARRRVLLIGSIAIAVTSVSVMMSLKQIPEYESQFQLLVENVKGENNKLAKLTEVAGDIPGSSGLDYETQIQVLRSSQKMSPIIQKLNSRYPDINYDSLMEQLTISRVRDTKILEVRYRDRDPQKVQFVLQQLLADYLKYSREEQQTSVKQGKEYLKKQLPGLRERVDKLQAKLQNFRQNYNLVEPEIQAKAVSERANEVKQQRWETDSQLQEKRSLYASLQRQIGLAPTEAIAAVNLSEAPRYQELLNKYSELENKIATELSRFNEDSPNIVALREEQENLKPLLSKEAATVLGATAEINPSMTSPSSIRSTLTGDLVKTTNEIKLLEVRSAAIAQTESNLAQEVRMLPVIVRQYNDLQRELKIATESLNRFLAANENLEIEGSQKPQIWELLLAPNKPTKPIPPNTGRNIILGAIAGLMLGIGAALVAERLDNVFHSTEELKELTKLPILGTIPFSKELKEQKPLTNMLGSTQQEGRNAEATRQATRSSDRKPQWYNASPFLEAFRTVNTNIRFLGSDTPSHSIVISSTLPSDGKSTVSVNLAQAAAAMGQRVLLVDADLRRPQVHNVLGIENDRGLSNVIATGMTPKEAIHRLSAWNQLYVLTAGQMPPDPTRLLSSKKMHYLMQQFHAVFDLVIYDTPPILGFADGRILAAHTDGIVLVVGMGKTDRSLLMQAIDGLKITSTPILGLVANGDKNAAHNASHYYDHYYSSDSEIDKAKKLLQKRIGM